MGLEVGFVGEGTSVTGTVVLRMPRVDGQLLPVAVFAVHLSMYDSSIEKKGELRVAKRR